MSSFSLCNITVRGQQVLQFQDSKLEKEAGRKLPKTSLLQQPLSDFSTVGTIPQTLKDQLRAFLPHLNFFPRLNNISVLLMCFFSNYMI